MTSNASRRARAVTRRQGASTAGPSSAPAGMWSLHGPDGSICTGWYLVPLRLFLGFTFLFAGLQKLANPDFLRSSSPISIHAQMVGVAHTSPIGGLLGHLIGAAPVIGTVIALGEVAVGVGALLGLLTRVAAAGGMLIAGSLFLAISFHSRPFYNGSDIVFLFAWTPLVLAGAAGAPALDTWLAARGGPSATGAATSRADSMSRGAFIGFVAAGAAVVAGAAAGLGRAFAGSATAGAGATLGGGGTTSSTVPSTTTTPTAGGVATTTTTGTVPKGTAIGTATQVPVGGSATFTDPSSGDPSLVIQRTTGQFVAFDAVCPHAGCTVAYQSGSNMIVCPCHGSEFDPKSGAVILGPATSGLTPIKVIKGSNGSLYVV